VVMQNAMVYKNGGFVFGKNDILLSR